MPVRPVLNAIENISGVGARVSCALAAATGLKPVAVSVLVVLVYTPGAVLTGTLKLTSNVQLAPAGIVPAVKLKLEVPVICEPVPHTSLCGKPVATMPVMAASKSSLKAKPLISKPLSILLIVKRTVVVLESVKVSGIKALVNVGEGAATIS